MQYYFETREQYITFLGRLLKISEEVRVVDDTPPGETFINEIKPYVQSHDWKKRIPGYGGKGRARVLNIPLSEKVEKIFRKYNSFLEIGYDEEYEYGVSMAFYKNWDLIFWIYAYDLICYLEEKYEKLFLDLI